MSAGLFHDDAFLASAAGAVVGAITLGALTYLFAPEVGGSWWPYIRVGAALVAAYIGVVVGQLLALGALIIGAVFGGGGA